MSVIEWIAAMGVGCLCVLMGAAVAWFRND